MSDFQRPDAIAIEKDDRRLLYMLVARFHFKSLNSKYAVTISTIWREMGWKSLSRRKESLVLAIFPAMRRSQSDEEPTDLRAGDQDSQEGNDQNAFASREWRVFCGPFISA